MGKRVRNRMELREQYDAAERQEAEEADESEDEEEEDEGDEEEGEGEAEEEDSDDDDEGGDDDDEDGPKKKKKKKVVKPVKPKAKPRTRTPKVVRKRVFWGVFNNSNQQVAKYDYPKRKEADEHAARLTADKKQTHFVQPVKETIDEKKEA
ncbi:MAG: hypothetical protein JNM56_06855 [Planctomycetia bacterium]|nr:hypothetical protein [Planctomycetia bacterium]